MLGCLEDWSQTDVADCFCVKAKPERIQDIKDSVLEALLYKIFPKSTAASLRGRLLHIAATRPGRTGRGNYHHVAAIAEGFETGWSVPLEIELGFILLDLEDDHTRFYPLVPAPVLGPRCWSDASFEPGHPIPKMRLCAIVGTSSHAEGVVCDIEAHTFSSLIPRSTQIMMGELLGVVLLFIHFPKELTKQSSIAFVDNMGVIHTIVNGASSEPDIGAVTQALHRRMSELGCVVWWEYVPSASNIADGGSRDGVTCKLSEAANITLKQVRLPVFPAAFPLCRPDAWTSWWS